jgi:hypothetical protein
MRRKIETVEVSESIVSGLRDASKALRAAGVDVKREVGKGCDENEKRLA